MKLRVMICAMAVSAALFADDVMSSTFGLMRVTDTASSNTVVGVPWKNIGDTGNVTLSNLVSTATLAADDIVYLYEGTTWYAYQLNAAGIWAPMTTVSGVTSGTPDAANVKTLARGTGLIIQRANNADPIYLCGRYDSSSPGSTTVAAGATALIANPKTEAKIIANDFGSVGDQISVPKNGGALDTYERRADGWYGTTIIKVGGRDVKKKSKLESGVEIAPGKGAWYINNGTADAVIAW